MPSPLIPLVSPTPLISRSLLVRWFILFAATIAGLILAAQCGVLTLIVASDVSYLSSVIFALFIGGSLYAGFTARAHDTGRPITDNIRVLNFITDQFTPLGLLGTVIGMAVMFHGALDPTTAVAAIIQQLKVGTATALYTTLAGLVSSLLLGLQTFVIQHSHEPHVERVVS